MRAERESVLTRTQAEGGHDQQRVRTLQRENAQLHLKVKGTDAFVSAADILARLASARTSVWRTPKRHCASPCGLMQDC